MMTLSNASGARHADKRGRIPFCWGGYPNFTKLETEAVNALRKDGDNINTLVFCCLDPLTGDIYVFMHECDPSQHGVYKFNNMTFKTKVPKEYRPGERRHSAGSSRRQG